MANVLTSAIGQWSVHTLLSAEEFGVGGALFGHGYDPSEITGDHDFAMKIEPQYRNTVKRSKAIIWSITSSTASTISAWCGIP